MLLAVPSVECYVLNLKGHYVSFSFGTYIWVDFGLLLRVAQLLLEITRSWCPYIRQMRCNVINILLAWNLLPMYANVRENNGGFDWGRGICMVAFRFKSFLPSDSAEFRTPARSVTVSGAPKTRHGNRVPVGEGDAPSVGLCLVFANVSMSRSFSWMFVNVFTQELRFLGIFWGGVSFLDNFFSCS